MALAPRIWGTAAAVVVLLVCSITADASRSAVKINWDRQSPADVQKCEKFNKRKERLVRVAQPEQMLPFYAMAFSTVAKLFIMLFVFGPVSMKAAGPESRLDLWKRYGKWGFQWMQVYMLILGLAVCAWDVSTTVSKAWDDKVLGLDVLAAVAIRLAQASIAGTCFGSTGLAIIYRHHFAFAECHRTGDPSTLAQFPWPGISDMRHYWLMTEVQGSFAPTVLVILGATLLQLFYCI